MRWKAALTLVGCGLALAGCGGGDADLTVYSGRNEELIDDLVEQFEDRSGLDVEVRYGDSAELAATLAEEGANSPADVFFAQDAGSHGSVERLLAPLPDGIADGVAADYRDPDARWVPTSARARVVAYNTEALDESDLPDSIWDFADDRWRGRIGLPPTNASFQAMVTGMRLSDGEERTREWLERIAALEPQLYENNIQTLEAIASGEVDVGFVNHYYLYGMRREEPEIAVENHHLAPGDAGSLVNVAGAGIVASTDTPRLAERFVRFLVSEEGQRYFAAETAEYPVAAGVEAEEEGLPPLESLRGPGVELGDFGDELERTLELLRETGLTP